MTSGELQTILSAISPVSLQTAEMMLDSVERKVFHKGDLIEKPGQRIRHEFIVSEGIVRKFVTNAKGDQFTIGFFTNGQAITPGIIRSIDFISYVNLEIISKEAEIISFSYSVFQKTMEGNRDIELFGNKVLMQNVFQRAEREKILLTGIGSEKLAWFRKYYRNLENEIPHYYTASFLGLTPTSLSRTRKITSR